MENKVLEKNIAHIEAYDANLANKLLRFKEEKSNINLLQSQNDEYNILFNGEILHCPQNPTLEAKNIVENIKNKDDKNTVRIIYGLSLGYLVDEFAKEIKEAKIIVYEPNIDLLHYVFSIAQIDALYQKNVVLCQDKQTFCKHIQKKCNENTQFTVTFLNSYKKLFFDDIKNILELAQKIQGEKIANNNTISKKAIPALVYTFSNLKKIIKNPDIGQLKDAYKGKTALIMCAGPSLEKNIDCIIENKNKFVTFALNPTLKLLSKKGFCPDFIVDIEVADNFVQFENVNLKESYLIAEPFVNDKVYDLEFKKIFNYVSEGNFLNSWLRNLLNIKDDLKTLGSVSYTALWSALFMGFEKIIFVGQDLAYIDGKCYAQGAQYENLKCVFDANEKKYKIITTDFDFLVKSLKMDSLTKNEQINFAKEYLEKMNDNLYTVLSQDGKPIPTQAGYAFFIDIFSKLALEMKEKKSHIELINSSVGGAQIEGFINMPLNVIVDELEEIEKLNFDNIENNYDIEKISVEFLKMKGNIEKFYVVVKNLHEVNQALYRELDIKKVYTPKAQKYFEKQEKCFMELESFKKVYNFDGVFLAYVATIANIISQGYRDDISQTKQAILKMNRITRNALVALPRIQEVLANH